jgi:ABC-type uncharacterized transport system substrate-binding protein
MNLVPRGVRASTNRTNACWPRGSHRSPDAPNPTISTAITADLIERQVVVIAAFGPPAVLAAKAATTAIPIVFMAGTDPIDLGLVTNFRRPTANVIGLTSLLRC